MDDGWVDGWIGWVGARMDGWMDDDKYDNFCGAITQHMPLQGRLDKKPSHVRDYDFLK